MRRRAVPWRDLAGVSYESAAANDFFTADNRTPLRLLPTPGVLRIVGNTSERTLWQPANFIVPVGDRSRGGFLGALG